MVPPPNSRRPFVETFLIGQGGSKDHVDKFNGQSISKAPNMTTDIDNPSSWHNFHLQKKYEKCGVPIVGHVDHNHMVRAQSNVAFKEIY